MALLGARPPSLQRGAKRFVRAMAFHAPLVLEQRTLLGAPLGISLPPPPPDAPRIAVQTAPAAAVVHHWATMFFLCADNRAECIASFGLVNTIDGWWNIVLPIGAIYRHIPSDCRIPDDGLHGVPHVTTCGISGMRDEVSAATGKPTAVAVRNFLQPILDVAHMEVKMVTKRVLTNDKANGKGMVGVRHGCAVHAQPEVGGTH